MTDRESIELATARVRNILNNMLTFSDGSRLDMIALKIAIECMDRACKYGWHDLLKDTEDLPDYSKSVYIIDRQKLYHQATLTRANEWCLYTEPLSGYRGLDFATAWRYIELPQEG